MRPKNIQYPPGTLYPFFQSLSIAFIILIFLFPLLCVASDSKARLKEIENRIHAYVPNPAYKDDAFALLVVKEALAGLKQGSGGIGACLLHEKTGEVVATGKNSQYTPYFRSDLHAEMDLLNRYEDTAKKKGGHYADTNPRRCDGLVLISSVEPCPMCMTRIINAGIKKMYYLVTDETGGMATRIDDLPPFWRNLAKRCDYRKADCAPELAQLAGELFNFSRRSFGKGKKGDFKPDGTHENQ